MKTILIDSGMFFLASFALSALLTPVVIWISRSLHLMAEPREDRWHRRPTALFGGVAIYFAFSIPFSLGLMNSWEDIVLLAGVSAMFLIGLVDDLIELTPQGKFLGQLAVSAFIVAGGLHVNAGYPAFSIMLSILWFVAIVNAFNILDNMDGLASGIAMVAAVSFYIFGLLNHKDPISIHVAALLAGASSGFLVYNFHPARVFMGDCGSLFMGTVLAMLSIMGTWNGQDIQWIQGMAGLTNLVLMLLVPVGVLVVPIFDTALVSFSRTQNGRSIFKGGRDHTSHRLVLLGLSETKAVLLLMLWAAFISCVTIVLSIYSEEGLAIALALLAIMALFFGIFLSNYTGTVYTHDPGTQSKVWPNIPMIRRILNKKQMLQAVLDMILIVLAYTAAYLLKFEGHIDQYNMELIGKSLPLLIAIKISAFWIFGLYRGQWRFVGTWDLLQLIKAILTSSVISMGVFLFLYRFEGFSRIVFVNDAMLTFFFVGGARLLLRLFKEYFERERERNHTTPILIVGAGDGGDLFLRELRKRSNHDYLPVGFIDDDKAKKGQVIHGVKVIGSRHDIPRLVKRFGVKRIFVAIMTLSDEGFQEFLEISKMAGVPVVRVPSLLSPQEASQEEGRAFAGLNKKVIRFRKKVK